MPVRHRNARSEENSPSMLVIALFLWRILGKDFSLFAFRRTQSWSIEKVRNDPSSATKAIFGLIVL